MKIYSINPGSVCMGENGRWGFNYNQHDQYGRTVVKSKDDFPTASAAKQAMRERIAVLRRQNGLYKPFMVG